MTSFRRFTPRDALLGVQIALCTLLVTASLVALRGMQRSLDAPLGIRPDGVTLASADLHMAGYSDDQSLPVQKRLIDAVARIPGVTAVGIAGNTPLSTAGGDNDVYREGTTIFRPSQSAADARYYPISPGYLHAAGTELLAGRDFTWHDDASLPKVAIVNETFARKLFGRSSAIGKRFLNGAGTRYQVIGVVQNGKYSTLTEEAKPAMFFPLAQSTDSDTTLVVRSHLSQAEITAALRRMLTAMEPSLPFTIQSWPDALALVYFPAQAAAASLGIMGLLAAMLAVTGLFGMAAYSVSKRMKELGIRVAMGAQPMQVVRSALGRPLALLVSGSTVGLALGALASRLLAQIVYEATPRDPVVLAGVALTMMLLGALATWIPARRALAIDPARLLREE